MLLWFIAYALLLTVVLALAGHRSRQASTTSAGSGTPPKRVLIVGATGGTGRQLVSQALERGYDVTALVRDRSRLAIEHARLTVVQGDVMKPGDADAAVRGQDAVVSALGHKRFFYPNRILSSGTRNVLAAMRTHGVRRFVCETSLGLGDSAGRMGLYYTLFVVPVILPFYFWDKARQERVIASSGVDWIIVRSAALTNGAPTGRARHGGAVGSYLWTRSVSRADVAAFMLDQLTSDAYRGVAVGVRG